MNLSKKEIGMGLVVVTCSCCGNVHKAHKTSNACAYGPPNYGCYQCQGMPLAVITSESCEYKGIVSSSKKQQKILNTLGSDMLLSISARPEFEVWFEANIEFGFGMGWMKGIAKKFCWHGYFAGYKAANNE